MAAAALPAVAAREATHDETFFGPEFFVALALLVLVVAIAKPVWRALSGTLDSHANAIRNELNEAQRLREDALALLADTQRRQREAAREAEAIVEAAREEARRIETQAAERTAQAMARREQQALDTIARAEAEATRTVRDAAVDLAIAATAKLLAEDSAGAKGTALIDKAIGELPRRLN
ncbi:MAG: F0F1 ATP synthase subunit B [Alphaproteobacteria bacterium]|nr:F0F1 ATP synthase subunit B [Alphaproteobacteria bacterium]